MRVGAVAMAVSLVSVMAACSNDSASDGDQSGNAGGSEDSTTIRFSWWGSDTRAQMQQEAIDVCTGKIPGLTVEAESTNYDSFMTKLSTQAAADDLPDVFTFIDPFGYDYMENGQLADLSEFSDVLDLSEFPEDTFADVLGENGEKLGVSSGVSGHGVVIDPTLFEEYGVEIPDDTKWTWDDFAKVSKEITEKSDGKVKGWFPEIVEQFPKAWLRQHGEEFGMLKEDQATAATVETMTSYWEMVKSLVDSGATVTPEKAQEFQAAGSPAEQAPVAVGEAAISGISMNQLGQYEDTAGHALQPMLWPGETEFKDHGGWTKQGTYFGIAASSDKKEKSAEFINCLVNDSEVAKIMGLDRGVPANTRLADELAEGLTDGDARFAEWIKRSQEANTQPFYRLNTGVSMVLTQEFQSANESVLFGQATPEEAAKTFIDNLNAAAD